jgi:hypothetical protein
MTIENILAQIDSEIAQLQQAKALLSGAGTRVGNGRKIVTAAKKAVKKASKRKPLSAEARKRIADAQRKRWAAAKAPAKKAVIRNPKPLAKKSSAKKTASKKEAAKSAKAPETTAAPF